MNKNKSFILASIILSLTILFIFYPQTGELNKYQWIPEKDGNKIRLNLLNLNPKKFVLIFPCTVTNNNWLIKSEGGPAFLIEYNNDLITMITGESNNDNLIRNEFNLTKLTKNKDCYIKLEYIKDNNQINILTPGRIFNFMISKNTSIFFSSHLVWNEELNPVGVVFEVESQDIVHLKNDDKRLMLLGFIIFLIMTYFYLRYNDNK